MKPTPKPSASCPSFSGRAGAIERKWAAPAGSQRLFASMQGETPLGGSQLAAPAGAALVAIESAASPAKSDERGRTRTAGTLQHSRPGLRLRLAPISFPRSRSALAFGFAAGRSRVMAALRVAVISAETPLILGSASPRRRELLEGLGLRLTVRPADVPEDRKPD